MTGKTKREEGGLGCDTNFWWWSNNIGNWGPVKHQRSEGGFQCHLYRAPLFSHPFLNILRILDTLYIVRDVGEAEGILSPEGHCSTQKSVGDFGVLLLRFPPQPTPTPPVPPNVIRCHLLSTDCHFLPRFHYISPFFIHAFVHWISIWNCDWLKPLSSCHFWLKAIELSSPEWLILTKWFMLRLEILSLILENLFALYYSNVCLVLTAT